MQYNLSIQHRADAIVSLSPTVGLFRHSLMPVHVCDNAFTQVAISHLTVMLQHFPTIPTIKNF